MSDVDWDAEDFEPTPAVAAAAIPRATDKWEGEDEDDKIRDNWDDEDEDKSETPSAGGAEVKKKKKRLCEIIAEKEAKAAEDALRRKREMEEKTNITTAEGRLAEKLRLTKIQQDADLQLAADLMGLNDVPEAKALDTYDLSTKEGLDGFRDAFITKVRSIERLEKKPIFTSFVEDLSRDLCINLESDEVKRVTTVLNALYNDKVKASKGKGKKKPTSKAKLIVGHGAITDDVQGGDDYLEEFDDYI